MKQKKRNIQKYRLLRKNRQTHKQSETNRTAEGQTATNRHTYVHRDKRTSRHMPVALKEEEGTVDRARVPQEGVRSPTPRHKQMAGGCRGSEEERKKKRLPYCSNFLNINDNPRYWGVRKSEGRVRRGRRRVGKRERRREGGKVPSRVESFIRTG